MSETNSRIEKIKRIQNNEFLNKYFKFIPNAVSKNNLKYGRNKSMLDDLKARKFKSFCKKMIQNIRTTSRNAQDKSIDLALQVSKGYITETTYRMGLEKLSKKAPKLRNEFADSISKSFEKEMKQNDFEENFSFISEMKNFIRKNPEQGENLIKEYMNKAKKEYENTKDFKAYNSKLNSLKKGLPKESKKIVEQEIENINKNESKDKFKIKKLCNKLNYNLKKSTKNLINKIYETKRNVKKVKNVKGFKAKLKRMGECLADNLIINENNIQSKLTRLNYKFEHGKISGDEYTRKVKEIEKAYNTMAKKNPELKIKINGTQETINKETSSEIFEKLKFNGIKKGIEERKESNVLKNDTKFLNELNNFVKETKPQYGNDPKESFYNTYFQNIKEEYEKDQNETEYINSLKILEKNAPEYFQKKASQEIKKVDVEKKLEKIEENGYEANEKNFSLIKEGVELGIIKKENYENYFENIIENHPEKSNEIFEEFSKIQQNDPKGNQYRENLIDFSKKYSTISKENLYKKIIESCANDCKYTIGSEEKNTSAYSYNEKKFENKLNTYRTKFKNDKNFDKEINKFKKANGMEPKTQTEEKTEAKKTEAKKTGTQTR